MPPLEVRGADGAKPSGDHTDRCWLSHERKLQLREIAPGEIGLQAREVAT